MATRNVIDDAVEALGAGEADAGGGRFVYERIVPAEPGSVARVRNELLTALAAQDLATTRRDQIALAVSEAATNAIVHAYVGRRAGPVYAAATLAGSLLALWVADHGRGMQASGDTAGAGFGLMLMHRLADDVQVSSDASGTCVQISFDDATAEEPQSVLESAGGGIAARRAMLGDYLRLVSGASARLEQDTRAVIAEAVQTCAHAQRQRALRRRTRAASALAPPR